MSDEKTIGEQNYEQFADRYAEISRDKPHNAQYNWPALLSLLPPVEGKHVLDAGCGPGFHAQTMLERGARVTAFDVTPDFVRITADRLSSYGDRARVLRADLNQPLSFVPDATVDVVLCSLVLDYIEDWAPVFKEFYRVLVPGGALVFSAEHAHGDYEWLHYRRGRPVDYFAVERFEVEWGGFGQPAPRIVSYRRPLSAQINPLAASGLVIEYLLEPLPTERFKELDPGHYAELRRLPGFVCIRARRPSV